MIAMNEMGIMHVNWNLILSRYYTCTVQLNVSQKQVIGIVRLEPVLKIFHYVINAGLRVYCLYRI